MKKILCALAMLAISGTISSVNAATCDERTKLEDELALIAAKVDRGTFVIDQELVSALEKAFSRATFTSEEEEALVRPLDQEGRFVTPGKLVITLINIHTAASNMRLAAGCPSTEEK